MVEFIMWVVYVSIYIGLIGLFFYVFSFLDDLKKKKPLYTDKELPKVSVIIAAFNEEKTIANTVKSILNSDYPKNKLEIIVVNDGSKDNTLKEAKKFAKNGVKIFSQKNMGKGAALNNGIKNCTGEIVFTLDADTYADAVSLKNMVRYFKDEKVFSVTPAMAVHKVTTIAQRIQHIEYLLGLFLRKAFASLNAVHITPGAFSAYRKSFFDKYGGYDVGNITEDLEMALRIQYHGYKIENSPESPVYTIAPSNFRALMKQRRRWYYGLMTNVWNKKYRKMFGLKYGDLGAFVLPLAWISIFFAVFLTVYLVFKLLFDVAKEIQFLYMVDWHIPNLLEFNSLFFERIAFNIFSSAPVIFILFFMFAAGFYLIYATKKLEKHSSLLINVPIFFVSFAVLFAFWWIVSLSYLITGKKVKWK